MSDDTELNNKVVHLLDRIRTLELFNDFPVNKSNIHENARLLDQAIYQIVMSKWEVKNNQNILNDDNNPSADNQKNVPSVQQIKTKSIKPIFTKTPPTTDVNIDKEIDFDPNIYSTYVNQPHILNLINFLKPETSDNNGSKYDTSYTDQYNNVLKSIKKIWWLVEFLHGVYNYTRSINDITHNLTGGASSAFERKQIAQKLYAASQEVKHTPNLSNQNNNDTQAPVVDTTENKLFHVLNSLQIDFESMDFNFIAQISKENLKIHMSQVSQFIQYAYSTININNDFSSVSFKIDIMNQISSLHQTTIIPLVTECFGVLKKWTQYVSENKVNLQKILSDYIKQIDNENKTKLSVFLKINDLKYNANKLSIQKNNYSKDIFEEIVIDEERRDLLLNYKNVSTIENTSNHNEYYGYGRFDKIFYPNESNREIAISDEMKKSTIEPIQNGRNVFIFGYGASGSGKTSTLIYFKKTNMNESSITIEEDGIIPYIIKVITKEDVTVKITEYYKHQSEDIYPENTEQKVEVSNIAEILQKYITTNKRKTKATPYNPQSSRSHIVATITFTDTNYGKLIIGDLAGMENEFNFKNENVIRRMNRNNKTALNVDNRDIRSDIEQNVINTIANGTEINLKDVLSYKNKEEKFKEIYSKISSKDQTENYIFLKKKEEKQVIRGLKYKLLDNIIDVNKLNKKINSHSSHELVKYFRLNKKITNKLNLDLVFDQIEYNMNGVQYIDYKVTKIMKSSNTRKLFNVIYFIAVADYFETLNQDTFFVLNEQNENNNKRPKICMKLTQDTVYFMFQLPDEYRKEHFYNQSIEYESDVETHNNIKDDKVYEQVESQIDTKKIKSVIKDDTVYKQVKSQIDTEKIKSVITDPTFGRLWVKVPTEKENTEEHYKSLYDKLDITEEYELLPIFEEGIQGFGAIQTAKRRKNTLKNDEILLTSDNLISIKKDDEKTVPTFISENNLVWFRQNLNNIDSLKGKVESFISKTQINVQEGNEINEEGKYIRKSLKELRENVTEVLIRKNQSVYPNVVDECKLREYGLFLSQIDFETNVERTVDQKGTFGDFLLSNSDTQKSLDTKIVLFGLLNITKNVNTPSQYLDINNIKQRHQRYLLNKREKRLVHNDVSTFVENYNNLIKHQIFQHENLEEIDKSSKDISTIYENHMDIFIQHINTLNASTHIGTLDFMNDCLSFFKRNFSCVLTKKKFDELSKHDVFNKQLYTIDTKQQTQEEGRGVSDSKKIPRDRVKKKSK